jgi:hypothetical protein
LILQLSLLGTGILLLYHLENCNPYLAACVFLESALIPICNTPECYLRIFLVIFYKEQWIQWMKVVLKINGNGELQV